MDVVHRQQTEIKIDFKYEHRTKVIEWLRGKAEKSDKIRRSHTLI